MVFRFDVIKIHCESSFAAEHFAVSKELYDEVKSIITNLDANGEIPHFYHNKYVLECENGICLGMCDGKAYIGTGVTSLNDDVVKVIDTNFQIIVKL